MTTSPLPQKKLEMDDVSLKKEPKAENVLSSKKVIPKNVVSSPAPERNEIKKSLTQQTPEKPGPVPSKR